MPKLPASSFNIGWQKWQKQITLALLTTIIAILGVFIIPQNTQAIPDQPTNDTTITTTPSTDPETTEETTPTEPTTTEESNTCYDQVGALSWLVCPATGALAKAIDNIYAGITYFLNVPPLSTDTNSPIYLIWEYARNITNIIFIIAILIIIYSQITGLGISNYGIKKALPRIVIIAITINLSYIVTAVAIDASNIIGHSLRGIFTSIQEVAIAGGTINPLTSNISVGDLVAGFVGTGSLAYAGITIAGGAGLIFWALIPIILAGFIAVITGLLTLIARQALVAILVMISPLALITYLLPNTESIFKKWKDLLLRMLILFPAISLLFGASQLAGWALIASATNAFGILLGIAVQIFPLFFSVHLMKMSGTIMGKINEAARKPFAPAQRALTAYSATRAQQARDNYTANSASGGAALRRYLAIRAAHRESQHKKSQEKISFLSNAYSNNKSLGKRRDGSIAPNKYMQREYALRELRLRSGNTTEELNEKMGTMSDYLKSNQIDTSKGIAAQIKALTARQTRNYLKSLDIKSAAARNDHSDKRFYYETVIEAAKDETSQAYKDHIISAAGTEGHSDDEKTRNDARTGVIAAAYSMFEAERKTLTSNYATYLSRQKTKDVLSLYDSNLDTKNIDAINAFHEVLSFRGDFDKIGAALQKRMDKGDYVELGTDFANTLALSLLGMKDKDPVLARLGKHINMETWKYSNDEDSRPKYVTMDEYITGIDANGNATKTGGMISLLKGTSLKGIERTAFQNINNLISNANPSINKDELRMTLTDAIMPQIISAIPTFETNSEQIMNTLEYLTGLKYNKISNQWEQSASNPPRTEIVRKYLSSLTPNDLIGLKTNAFQAAMATLTIENHGNENAAKAEFKAIQESNGNLAKLRAFEPNVISPMKESVFKTLDIPMPPRNP